LVALRRQLALVSQQIVLFNDSISHNIAYGDLRKHDAASIEAAARAAHAWEFIESLPQGINTNIGERGALLSGGQRQRLAIARALLKDAPILILDEATSGLDNRSEQHVQEALRAVMSGRTTLVIAHRLSTVELANRIIVLDEGRIAEQGTHTELLERGGIYAQLYQARQSDAAE